MKKCPKCGTVFDTTNTLCPNDGAVLVKTGDTLLGQTLAGKYRIDEKISEGGMGTVYRATHIVMEYWRGRTLKQVIRASGPLRLSRAIEIARQVADALDAAHAEGVVHRDLKSDNIMLEEVGSSTDWAKVLDFGIAKIQEPVGQDPELTAPNLIIGTPQYMSPEQCSQAAE